MSRFAALLGRSPTQRSAHMELPDRSQARSWEGKDVVDRDGQRLGRCVGVFADTATGVPFDRGDIIAMLHDAIVTLGYYAFTGREFNLTSIAVILLANGFTGPGPIGEVLARHPRLALVFAHLGAPEYEGFLDLAAADPGHYVVLDARAPVDAISTAIRERLAPLLEAR